MPKRSFLATTIACLLTAATWAGNLPATAPGDDDDAEVPPPRSVTFSPAGGGSLEVIRAATGHLLVKPKVNGRQVGYFIFDTGAGITCIDPEIAADLKLPEGHEITATGSGGEKKTKLRQAESVELGPVELHDLAVMELDLKSLEMFLGKPIAGVIGYEIFKSAVFEVDLLAPSIVVHDPKSFSLPAGATWSDLTLRRRRPFVTGQIEANEPGLFLLDIGANNALVVHSPAVNKFRLLEDRKLSSGMFGGVGGLKKVKSGAVRKLVLCGQEIADVAADFSQATEGATADDYSQGAVGVGVLKQFRMIVNYPEKKIALIKKD